MQAQTAAAPAAPAAAGEAIDASDAQKLKDSIGKEVKVSGKVVNVGSDTRSGNVFLNFSRDRESGFVVMIKGSVAKSAGCSGKVTVEAKLKNKRVARKTATVSSACRFSSAITLPRKGTASITASFTGNARITAVTARAVKVRAG